MDTPQFRELGYSSYLTFLVPGMLSVLFTALQTGMALGNSPAAEADRSRIPAVAGPCDPIRATGGRSLLS